MSMGTKRIALGADHGGFELKASLAAYLRRAGHAVEDVGTSSREAVDYPVFARAVAEAVSQGRADVGIMIDGAGIGSCMVANKVPGVRAALAYDLSSARNSREHNDANVLTLGAGLIGAGLARQIVDTWLSTDCTEPRHRTRVAMIVDSGSGGVQMSDADIEIGTLAPPSEPANTVAAPKKPGLPGSDIEISTLAAPSSEPVSTTAPPSEPGHILDIPVVGVEVAPEPDAPEPR